MDAELMTIFSNIQSLIDQAKQMTGGQGQPTAKAEGLTVNPEEEEKATPDVAEKIMKFLKQMDEEPEKKEEKPGEVEKCGTVKKADQPALSSPDEGATASDKATQIIEETTPEQEKNLNEIARALVGMMANKSQNKTVKKSQDNSELYSVIKAMVDDQTEIKKSIANILSGLGVADQIKKMSDVQKSEDVRRPQNDQNDIRKSLDYIKHELGIQDNRPVGNMSGESVHKSLSDALSTIAPNLNSWGR